MTDVVAALFHDQNKFMICQRPATKARALLWEFVGGKVEKGETPQAALERECREELDVQIEVGSLFCEVTHEYPDITIRLCVYHARIVQGPPKLLEHADLRWITPNEIDRYSFCPADMDILNKIKTDFSANSY